LTVVLSIIILSGLSSAPAKAEKLSSQTPSAAHRYSHLSPDHIDGVVAKMNQKVFDD
jgi:hypothetical protein